MSEDNGFNGTSLIVLVILFALFGANGFGGGFGGGNASDSVAYRTNEMAATREANALAAQNNSLITGNARELGYHSRQLDRLEANDGSLRDRIDVTQQTLRDRIDSTSLQTQNQLLTMQNNLQMSDCNLRHQLDRDHCDTSRQIQDLSCKMTDIYNQQKYDTLKGEYDKLVAANAVKDNAALTVAMLKEQGFIGQSGCSCGTFANMPNPFSCSGVNQIIALQQQNLAQLQNLNTGLASLTALGTGTGTGIRVNTIS